MTDRQTRANSLESFRLGRVLVLVELGPLDTPCHVWQGATVYGYPSRGNGAGRVVRGHREAYEKAYGPIPDGFDVHHLCGNRRCINPEHLEATSRREHVQKHRELEDGVVKTLAKSRERTHLTLGIDGRKILSETCNRGHPWTEESTSWRSDGHGRTCRICRNLRRKERTQ